MKKIRALYIALLIVVGLLLGYIGLTVTNYLSQSEKSTVLVQKQELIEPGDKAIIRFRIINPARHDRYYSYKIFIDGSLVDRDRVSIPAGGYLLRPWHLYPTEEGKKEVNIIVYEEDKPEPIENITYYIFVNESRK